MAQQTKHAQHPASSPSRPRRPGAGVAGGSGPRRAFHCGARRSCRWSECRKSLQAPGLGAFRRLTRGGDCVQEESEGGTEYVANHQGSKAGKEESRVEPALLVSPLNGEEASDSGEGATTNGSAAPLCKGGAQGPCARNAYSPCGLHGCKKYVRHPPVSPSAGVPSWAKTVVDVGREVFGIVHCAYELWKQYGAGCGNP
jgi:hypothetical protein